jgi:hypothetical protein
MNKKVRIMRKEIKRHGMSDTLSHERIVVLSSFPDRSGNVFRPLTYKEEDAWMPQILSMESKDIAFRKAVTEYYKNLRKKIQFEGVELEVGLDDAGNPYNLEDYILFKLCVGHPKTGKTKEEAFGNKLLDFYVEDPEAEDEANSNILEVETKAMVEFAKLVEDENKLDLVLRNVIIKYPEIGSLTELLALKANKKQLKIGELIKRDAAYFLSIVNDKDLTFKAEIVSMVEAGILVKEGNRYLNGSSNLGDLNGTIAFFKDNNNSMEYVTLQARLSEFGVPLKEYSKKQTKK